MNTVATTPFEDQRPGTSGLRKKVQVFQQPHYLENFVQSVFDALEGFAGPDPGGRRRWPLPQPDRGRRPSSRWPRPTASGGSWSARAGCCRRPAASAVIRKHQAFGGIILSASHNPGGPDGDFGIKYNVTNGGPAPEKMTEAIYRRTRADPRVPDPRRAGPRLDRLGETRLGEAVVEVIDPVADYQELMARPVRLRAHPRRCSRAAFGSASTRMSAVTGPYARAILERTLGAPAGSVINGEPLRGLRRPSSGPQPGARQGADRG